MNVSETKLGNLLGEINSEAKTKRQIVVSYSLNPKVYSTKYRGDKIHYNQNDKLGMFRFAHVCAWDGFSGKIVEYATMAKKNRLVIYEEVYSLMTAFFIYKGNIFRISQVFWSFL